MVKANKFLEKKSEKKAAKTERKQQQNKQRVHKEQTAEMRNDHIEQQPKNFASTTVTGETIIECRDFNLDSQREFEYCGGYKNLATLPIYGLPEIAFIGRSNVRKSSLLNTLTGANKKVAIVSQTPGRTQLINMFKCGDHKGDLCMFVDLPGYGFAKMSKAQQVYVFLITFTIIIIIIIIMNRTIAGNKLKHVHCIRVSRRETVDVKLCEREKKCRRFLDFVRIFIGVILSDRC